MEYIEQKPTEPKPHAKRNKILIAVFTSLAVVIATVLGYYFMISRVFIDFRDLPYLSYTRVDGGDDTQAYIRIDSCIEDDEKLPKKFHIPSKIEGIPVTEISSGVFSGCQNIEEMFIPNSVKKIGTYAFANCPKLKKISIPTSLEFVGIGAFDDTQWLEDQKHQEDNTSGLLFVNEILYSYKGEIPAGSVILGTKDSKLTPKDGGLSIPLYKYPFKSFSGGAFKGQKNLWKVELPENLTFIEHNMFSDCTSLEEVVFQEGLTSINDEAFMNCKNLKMPNWPSSLVEIKDKAFYKSGIDGELNFGADSNLQKFGVQSFFNCQNITKVNIPKKVSDISESLFAMCASLSEVSFNPETEYSENSLVQTIGRKAFKHTNLSSIKIPYSVTSIKEEAFADCANLTSVDVYNNTTGTRNVAANYDEYQGLKSIEDKAFYKATNFKNLRLLDINGNVVHNKNSKNGIEDYDVNFPVTLLSLGSDGSTGTSIFSQTSVTSVDFEIDFSAVNSTDEKFKDLYSGVTDKAFNAKSGLKSISPLLFAEAQKLVRVHFPEKPMNKTITSIGNGAFIRCNNLKTINNDYLSLENKIPDDIILIGASAFNECTSLTSVELSQNITTITTSMFQDSSIESIVVPYKTNSIEAYAFNGCSNLANITFKTNASNNTLINKIGEGAFKDCLALTSFKMPNTIIGVGNRIFQGCTNLDQVVVSNKLTRYSQFMFDGCEHMKSISFADDPSLVKPLLRQIEQNAFANCKELLDVTIPFGVTEIRENAFMNCIGLTEIYIPRSVSTIRSDAFKGCAPTLKIRCEANSKPSGWAANWAPEGVEILWGQEA